MQEFPLSKLKIKIRGLDNPTSVFKKRSYLSLNCIQKQTRAKTPLNIYSNNELPHYMLPIKCQQNQTENNNKSIIKLKEKKPKIKLTIMSRNKTDIEINSKENQDHKNNKIDGVFNTINFNKNNLNTNFFANAHLNDYSSSNKDNNENIISELNIINQNNNNYNTSFEDPSYNSLISDLQKKITEQNILLSSRRKEIENLKMQVNKNNNLNSEINSGVEKNEINKLKEEIKSLKINIENLSNKYQTELNNKNEIEEKYELLKNNIKDNLQKQEKMQNYENKITQQENKIILLQEEINKIKNRKLNITKEINFEIISHNKNKLILSQKQYNDIQLLLNVLLDIHKIEKNNISNLMENNQSIGDMTQEIIKKLKLHNKDNDIIEQYINDLITKTKTENNNLVNELENLFKYKYNNKNQKYYVINSKNKKIIYEKCKKYDYKNKHKIPFYYFKHLFKEICYKNKNPFAPIEFFNLLYECKTSKENEIYSLYDVFYENLKDGENKENKLNIEYKLKYPNLVKNFLDKIIKEAYDKKKENFGDNKLNRARSFEQDFFEETILDSESNDKKLNLDGDNNL